LLLLIVCLYLRTQRQHKYSMNNKLNYNLI